MLGHFLKEKGYRGNIKVIIFICLNVSQCMNDRKGLCKSVNRWMNDPNTKYK